MKGSDFRDASARDLLSHQRQVRGKGTRIYDLTRPPANRAERRMVVHIFRSQQKKQKEPQR